MGTKKVRRRKKVLTEKERASILVYDLARDLFKQLVNWFRDKLTAIFQKNASFMAPLKLLNTAS